MTVEDFSKGDTVSLKTNYQDEGRSFKAGDKGRVSGHDALLIRVRMPTGYEICLRPVQLIHANRN